MKTIVISLFSLMFMISVSAFADGDGTKESSPKGKTETVAIEATINSATNLNVIHLNESAESNGLPRDIIEQFGEVLSYPEDVVDAAEEECVLIGFTYNDDGYLEVENTRSSNESFNHHVVSNIEKIRLRDGSVTIGKTYFAKFSFKKL